ncbi:MAG: efflux transporter periplasmic adaptor subunit [Cytophagaceae bacterium]|nr:efflux transporter periplasmic adaptor subunit [Cytophagaceae bacterium]|tara:strand:+ start:11083 stop:12144 length:1062 start_codon:yes stop_codon:yes gene_type:complete
MTKYFIYILIGLGVSALVIYRIVENSEGPKAGGQPRAATATVIEGMVLRPQAFAEDLSLSGSLEANEQLELHSEVSGVVESINFNEGRNVAKGQVLFRVNDLEMRAQLAKAKTAERLASENQRRAKLLLEKQAISQEEYDIAEADYQSAQAEAQLIDAQLAKATVRAPFSGTIGLRNISQGTYVTPATLIAKLVNTDKLKITFNIPEKYASQIQLNDTLNFTTSSSDKTYAATIYAIEPEIEVVTRTLKLRAVADNSDGTLIPGTYANVTLPLAPVNDALLVPAESLIPIQNGKMIYVLKGGVAKEVEVKTGTRTNTSVRVVSGLKPNDTILTSGVMTLKDGLPVKMKLINAQ